MSSHSMFNKNITYWSVGFLVLLTTVILSMSSFLPEQTNEDEFGKSSIKLATHYYGLKEYSWPINYLNAISDEDILSDLLVLRKMGFDTIILLVSWSEFEPKIGTPNESAYQKIDLIIKSAEELGLNVMLRVPYIWSLNGTEIRERVAYALISKNGYLQKLLRFLEYLDYRIVQPNPNVISKFGSWEDYYVLRDLFFSYGTVSESIKELFTLETGIDSSRITQNGENYDILLEWIDSRIRFTSESIGEYGFEVRTDADIFVMESESFWHSHKEFYKNTSGGELIAYWAPYYGQSNQGEEISADSAIASLEWMLESIFMETNDQPFLDQLNYFDNTHGTSKNAKISVNQYQEFFEKLPRVIFNHTKGYALWTIRDYRHNLVYNPSFSDGLDGWVAEGKVITHSSGVELHPDHGPNSLTQHIPKERFLVLSSSSPKIVVEVISGSGAIEIGETQIVPLPGPGRYTLDLDETVRSEGLDIKLTAENSKGNTLQIKWVALMGHYQKGLVLKENGAHGKNFQLITNLNASIRKLIQEPCGGYGKPAINRDSDSLMYRGVFADGWTETEVHLCLKEPLPDRGIELDYTSPITSSTRTAKIEMDSGVVFERSIKNGQQLLRLCPKSGKKIATATIIFSPSFKPRTVQEGSADVRNLGVHLNNAREVQCN